MSVTPVSHPTAHLGSAKRICYSAAIRRFLCHAWNEESYDANKLTRLLLSSPGLRACSLSPQRSLIPYERKLQAASQYCPALPEAVQLRTPSPISSGRNPEPNVSPRSFGGCMQGRGFSDESYLAYNKNVRPRRIAFCFSAIVSIDGGSLYASGQSGFLRRNRGGSHLVFYLVRVARGR